MIYASSLTLKFTGRSISAEVHERNPTFPEEKKLRKEGNGGQIKLSENAKWSSFLPGEEGINSVEKNFWISVKKSSGTTLVSS